MKYPVSYIEHTENLNEVIKVLQTKPAFGIDLEFDKNHYRYGFNLCLMQLFDGNQCYLVDPLSKDLDIGLIFPLLANEQVKKICFAFNEDMRLLTHLGCDVKGVRDMAIARIVLGKEGLSLSKTLVDELGREPQNSLQKSNWFQRPLSDEQKHYAALDVVDLLELNDQLTDQLEQMNRVDWFAQEMNQFETSDWDQSDQPLIADKERKDMTLREWIRYEKLMTFRDQVSEKMNRPAYKVMDKNIIKDIARKPEKVQRWDEEKRIHPKYRNQKTADQIVNLLKEADLEFSEKNLDDDTPARRTMSKEEKMMRNRERARINSFKEDFFKPVKSVVAQRYGEHLANYMLSNRRIAEIVTGKTTLLDYQKRLIENAVNETGLKMPGFIN